MGHNQIEIFWKSNRGWRCQAGSLIVLQHPAFWRTLADEHGTCYVGVCSQPFSF